MCVYIYIRKIFLCLQTCKKYDNILIYTGFDFPTGIAVKYDTIEWLVSNPVG